MSMRPFGFDDGYLRPDAPGWSRETFLIEGELPPQRFEEDLARFEEETERLSMRLPLEPEPPEGTVLIGNRYWFPFDDGPLYVSALQQRRYAVYMVNNAVNIHGKREPTMLALYAGQEDRGAVRRLLEVDGVISPVGEAYRRLLLEVMPGTLHNVTFLQGHPHNEARNTLYAAIGGTQSELVRRAFMTSALLWHMRQEAFSSSLAHIEEDSRMLYNLFHAQGLRPLGYEDLFGMAEAVVTDKLQADPQIPAPFAVRREGEGD